MYAVGAASLGVAPGCGGERSRTTASGRRDRGRASTRSRGPPSASAATRSTCWNLTPPGAEPHDVELSRARRRSGSGRPTSCCSSAAVPARARGRRSRRGRRRGRPARRPAPRAQRRRRARPRTAPAADEPRAARPARVARPAALRRAGAAVGRDLGRPAAAARLVPASCAARTASFERGLAECERREIVTSHAAFGYLADRVRPRADRAHGALARGRAERRATSRTLVDEVREHGATTVFFETLVSPRLAETVAREAGAETAVLNPLEGLTEEELEGGEDYLSVMRANLAALRERSDAASRRAAGRRLRVRAGPPVLRDVDLARRGRRVRRCRGPERRRQDHARPPRARLEEPSCGAALLSASRRRRFGDARASAISPSAARLDVDAPGPCARSWRPDGWPRGLLGPLRRGDRRIVDEAIERVGLTAERDRPLDAVGRPAAARFIAKALAGEPALLVLDEPTTGVDAEAQEALAALLDELHGDLGVDDPLRLARVRAVERFVERLVLVRGGIVFDGPPPRLPGVWHDPSHVACLRASSCAWPSRRARSSACSRRPSASSWCSGGMSLIGDGIGHVAFAGVAARLPARTSRRSLTALVGRGRRRGRDRVAARAPPRGRRPGARARLLHGHRGRRRARLGWRARSTSTSSRSCSARSSR